MWYCKNFILTVLKPKFFIITFVIILLSNILPISILRVLNNIELMNTELNQQKLSQKQEIELRTFREMIIEDNPNGHKHIKEINPVLDKDTNEIRGFDIILNKLGLLGIYVTGTQYKILGVMMDFKGDPLIYVTKQKGD